MTGKKILVTGSDGILGSSLCRYLTSHEWQVIACNRSMMDITKGEEVSSVLKCIQPNIIIHTAAYTNVEACENDRDAAYLINCIGTQNLVNYAADNNILFVYISSTGIYGGASRDVFNEFDEPHPTTVHHHTKYLAEKIVEKHIARHLIIRTGWLFGSNSSRKMDFVFNRYIEAKSGGKLRSNSHQIGNPTYVEDLSSQIMVLINSGQYGIFNCVNTANGISRYDYVKKIVEHFGLDTEVEPVGKGAFHRVANVADNESAINHKLNLLGLNIMRDWDIALGEYIDSIKKVTI